MQGKFPYIAFFVLNPSDIVYFFATVKLTSSK